MASAEPRPTRQALLEAATSLMLSRGYAGTSVDEICQGAGVKKGTFFHHFPSKEALGVEALRFYRARTTEAFADAPFATLDDPLERLLAYVDYFVELVGRPEVPSSCLFGNLAQELAPSSGPIQAACEDGLGGWASEVAALLDAARSVHRPVVDFSSESVGRHFVATYEGALVLSKALGDREVVAESLRHFRAYVALLFART